MEIKHPSGGGYVGGLAKVIIRTWDMDSDEDCYMWRYLSTNTELQTNDLFNLVAVLRVWEGSS